MASEAKTLTVRNAEELADWCGGKLVLEHDALDDGKTSPGINVPCKGLSVKRASVGDMITRTHDGVFDVIKAEKY